jgi:hypothetical protein
VNRLRLWILGAALGSFLAGMNVGLVIPKVVVAYDATAGVPEYEDYVRRIAAEYKLSAAQEHSLRLVMQAEEEEVNRALRSADMAQLPAPIRSKLLAARSRSEQRMRAMLTDAQRERYDLDSRPQQNR